VTLVGVLARAVGEHGPARVAAERYAAHLAQSRGADEATLISREKKGASSNGPSEVSAESPADPPEWGGELPVSIRLYCAELSVVLLELVPLVDRLGFQGARAGARGVGLDAAAVELRLRQVCDPSDGSLGSSKGTAAGLVPQPLMSWLGHASAEISEALADALANESPRSDPFEDVAQQRLTRLLPAVIRHDLGIHFTPGWTAREVVRRAMETASKTVTAPGARRVADPACGTGVFLLEVLRWKWLDAGKPRGRRVWQLLSEITGVEASPLVACVARLALLRAGLDLAGGRSKAKATAKAGTTARSAVRVLAGDVLCDLRDSGDGMVLRGPKGDAPLDRCQVLVGNPPWVAWDALPAGYKQRLGQGLLQEYELFELRGFEARLGGANDDLSGVFTLVVLDRLLSPGGRLAFLLKLNLLTNESARTFRRFRVKRHGVRSPGVSFAVEQLCDLRRANPFAAAVEPALLVLARDRVMGDSIASERWERGRDGVLRVVPQPDYTRVQAGADGSTQGPWAPRSEARRISAGLAGDFPYDIRHGLKHDCNAVFLVELLEADGKNRVRLRNRPETARRIHAPEWTGSLERHYVRPLLQSRHIRPLALTGWAHALVPATDQGRVEPDELAAKAPATLAYLEAMRPVLGLRRSKVFRNPPFYRVFAVGPYNWAPSLVVWCGMALRPWFAVVDEVPDPLLGDMRPIPDSSCYLVPLQSRDEACYLAGLLNSGPVRDFLASRSSGSKRGLSRAVVSRLGLPRYDPKQASHRALAGAADSLCRVGAEPCSNEVIAKALDPRARKVLR
jgi:hypothetical protein